MKLVEMEEPNNVNNSTHKKTFKLGDIECPEFLDYNEYFDKKRKGSFNILKP